jgi:3-phenylpropionate/trans-cinnamate dioxygenase ferredoxin subunit
MVTVEGKEVALFNVDGAYYAVGGRCPHRSGPLAKGKVEKVPLSQPSPQGGEGKGEGTVWALRCPLHGWLFELSTGRCLTRPGAGIPIYPVRCEDGQICLG